MNIKIDSNFQFSVASIQYTASGELSICLTSDEFPTDIHYQYSASLGNGQAEERLFDNFREAALCYFPKSSECVPNRTSSMISRLSSIHINKKSLSMWHSRQPLYLPTRECGKYSSGIGCSFTSRSSNTFSSESSLV